MVFDRFAQIDQPNRQVISGTGLGLSIANLTAQDDKQKALDAGCIDYISKPIDPDLLLVLIEKHISK